MLQLWSANNLGTPQTRIGPLAECTEALVRRKINDEYTLTMKLPNGTTFCNDIEPGCVVIAPVNESGTEDRFVIKQRVRNLTGGLDVYAEHQSYLYNGYICTPITILRGYQGPRAMDVYAAIRTQTSPYVAANQFVWDGTLFRLMPRTSPPRVPVSTRSLLLGWFVKEFGGELDFYRTVITWKERLGADHGASIKYAVNMIGMEESDVLDDYASGILPFWGVQGDSSRPMTLLTERYIEYSPTQNWPIRNIIPVDFTDYFDTQPTEADLRAAAQNYATEHAVPYIPKSISAERIERPGDRPISLGDDIAIDNPTWHTKTKIRVVGITFDALRRRTVEVELGTLNQGFAGAVRNTK